MHSSIFSFDFSAIAKIVGTAAATILLLPIIEGTLFVSASTGKTIGRVVFDDRVLVDLPERELTEQRLRFGFLFQGAALFDSLSVGENLEMGTYLAPKRFTERFDYVAGIFPRLAERKYQRAGSLSGGERQMVAMGRALMMEPFVLLLDEPSAGLSPKLQDQVFIRAQQVNRAGVTTIMVEQNARRCLQICDRGYVLDQGRNAYTASGRDLMHDPKVIELYLGTLARV